LKFEKQAFPPQRDFGQPPKAAAPSHLSLSSMLAFALGDPWLVMLEG